MHAWLPDHQLGVAAMLSHADELIGQVSELLFDFQAQPEGIVGLVEVPAGKFSKTVVDRITPIPRKVPLLVADALVALRAALEHALFAEVEFLDGSPLDEKAAKLVSMPASEMHEDFEDWQKKRLKNGPPSLRPGGKLLPRVSALQPFHHQTDPKMHPLARLTLHTNHAKHRRPANTAVRLVVMYSDDQIPRSLSDLLVRPEEPLRVGEVIAETPRGPRTPVTLFSTVALNRPDTDQWPVLTHELRDISHWVRTEAVPRLITGAEPPEPVLPTRYEIAVGHEDERQAMAAGSTTSATERHQQRLEAAVVREGLADTIARMTGSASGPEIAEWLASLTDEDMLNLMSGLQPTFDHDPDIVQANVEILKRLRDEALGFGQDDQTIQT